MGTKTGIHTQQKMQANPQVPEDLVLKKMGTEVTDQLFILLRSSGFFVMIDRIVDEPTCDLEEEELTTARHPVNNSRDVSQ